MLTINEERNGNSASVGLKGELVAADIASVTARFKAIVADGCTAIRIDFTSVTAIDSAGIGFLAAVYNSVKKRNGILHVAGLSREMYQFFVSLRLNTHFTIEAVPQ